MFNLGKKYKTINSYPDIWEVSDATLGNDPFLRRICTGLKDAIGHPDYKYQIGIAIPLNWETDSGIISNVESNAVEKIELLIEEKVESENTRLVAILTGRNMREFILYTSEPDIVREKLEELKNEINSHELQYIIQEDSAWNTYKFIMGK